MNSEPQRERHPIAFDDSTVRWYHYALRRLPVSLLVSLVTLIFVVPIFVWLSISIYVWFAG